MGREEQDRRVGGGDEEVGDGILFLGRHPRTALAAAFLGAEGLERCALDIAAEGNGDDHVLALDQILVVDTVPGGGDLADAGGRIGFGDLVEFLDHHFVELGPVSEDFEQLADRGGQLAKLAGDLVAA
jgi:hypothetical protein